MKNKERLKKLKNAKIFIPYTDTLPVRHDEEPTDPYLELLWLLGSHEKLVAMANHLILIIENMRSDGRIDHSSYSLIFDIIDKCLAEIDGNMAK